VTAIPENCLPTHPPKIAATAQRGSETQWRRWPGALRMGGCDAATWEAMPVLERCGVADFSGAGGETGAKWGGGGGKLKT
jgi:hypothetical protein